MRLNTTEHSRASCVHTLGRAAVLAACLAAIGMASAPAAGDVTGLPAVVFDMTMQSLNLSGGPFPISLAADPTNALGDSVQGYGFVDSQVTITLSSQRPVSPGPATSGKVIATRGIMGPDTYDEAFPEPIDPVQRDGEPLFVASFFDVFFDITIRDVDARPGRDYAGAPDGASLALLDVGPATITSMSMAAFDRWAPNFGLFPPPSPYPYLGSFDIEIPLEGDINGNGENDKVKIALAAMSFNDGNRTFIPMPDHTTINQSDAAMVITGTIVDMSTDPPFTIGLPVPNTSLPDPDSFAGPTTISSKLLNPIVPEPATLALLAAGAAILGSRRRRK